MNIFSEFSPCFVLSLLVGSYKILQKFLSFEISSNFEWSPPVYFSIATHGFVMSIYCYV